MPGNNTIFTIGHSTRQIEEFVALLEENEIELLADVRSMPRSKLHPQFNIETLPGELAEYAIGYMHIPALGGLRGKQKGPVTSHNTAWDVANFRNYADYAETKIFRDGLEQLTTLARDKRTCYMCAEAVWWRCHRRIITDYLLARGWQVKHIMAAGKVNNAELNENAIAQPDGTLHYPGDQQELRFE